MFHLQMFHFVEQNLQLQTTIFQKLFIGVSDQPFNGHANSYCKNYLIKIWSSDILYIIGGCLKRFTWTKNRLDFFYGFTSKNFNYYSYIFQAPSSIVIFRSCILFVIFSNGSIQKKIPDAVVRVLQIMQWNWNVRYIHEAVISVFFGNNVCVEIYFFQLFQKNITFRKQEFLKIFSSSRIVYKKNRQSFKLC